MKNACNKDILKMYNINKKIHEFKMQYDFNKMTRGKETKTNLVIIKENEQEFSK